MRITRPPEIPEALLRASWPLYLATPSGATIERDTTESAGHIGPTARERRRRIGAGSKQITEQVHDIGDVDLEIAVVVERCEAADAGSSELISQ